MTFERAPGLEYEMDNLEAKVFDIGGASPTSIIKTSQAWQVKLEWEAVGVAVAFYSGTYVVDAFIESIGPGIEDRLGPINVALVPGQVSYTATIFVLANKVTLPAGQDSIPVKIVTTVTVKDGFGNPVPMAAYVEGPILQFFL
jgi:hypothetical protein